MMNSTKASPELLEMVVCPVCRAGLVAVDAVSFRCTSCSRVYPIVDGIPVLLVGAQSKEP
jgi:uncharacterized protein YbaR (Trm112 family)